MIALSVFALLAGTGATLYGFRDRLFAETHAGAPTPPSVPPSPTILPQPLPTPPEELPGEFLPLPRETPQGGASKTASH